VNTPRFRPPDFPALDISHPEVIAGVRNVLDQAGYTKYRIREALGLDTWGEPLEAANLVRLTRRLGSSALETLIELFVLGRPVAIEAVGQALAPMTLEEWHALGLLQSEDATATALYELHAGDDLILALPVLSRKMPPSREVLDLHRDLHSPQTWLLDDLTIRRPDTTTLNVGIGVGIRALRAAAHTREVVVAVDGNPRLADLCTFNAGLNGLSNLKCRAGEWAEVASEQRIDLIVCHPSVAVAPPLLATSHADILPGDGTYESLVRTLPRFLHQGGYAQILIHWAHLQGEDNQERLRRWLAGSGCDAWVLRFKAQDPESYALEMLPEPPDENLAPFRQRSDAWMAYYARQGIEAVSSGLLTVRARAGHPNWFRCEDMPSAVGSCSDALVRGFDNQTFLSAQAAEFSLLETPLSAVPELRREQHWQLASDRWTITVSELQLPTGFIRTLSADDSVMQFLQQCRGQQTLREILDRLAVALQQDPAVVTAEGIRLARLLLEQGFVTPS
jgi:hypothetical protein